VSTTRSRRLRRALSNTVVTVSSRTFHLTNASRLPAPTHDGRVLKLHSSKVTFVLPGEVRPVSVVGDWNDWDPMAHPVRRRSNPARGPTWRA
jgi:hypothetical protein